MFLEIAQYFSSFVIAVAGFLGAIVGIQKFIDTYTAKGKARVATREEAKKKQLQEISKETARTLMGEFKAHQEEVTGEILSRLDEISERVDDIEQVNHSQNEMFQLLNKKVDRTKLIEFVMKFFPSLLSADIKWFLQQIISIIYSSSMINIWSY